ncbi:MAG: formate dehydrogenase subunit alpha [Sulfolobaceae archaeon]
MPKILVDNTVLEANEGELLIDALLSNNIYLPHICYHKPLPPLRTCDLCIVEVNGKLVRACETRITEGMVINTKVQRVKEARNKALSIILRNHLLYCTLCENNNGDCELHEIVIREGIKSQDYKEKPYSIDDSNPFYIYDPGQCILCGRCVEACQDIVVNEVIRIAWELNPPRVVWSGGENIDNSSCVSCGTCVTVCPVNALMEKTMLNEVGLLASLGRDIKLKLIESGKKIFKNFEPLLLISDLEAKLREYSIKRVKTVCPYCGVGCSFEMWVKGRKILKVEPKPESPANGIATCIKGKFSWSFVNDEKRLTKPLERTENGFREVSWDYVIEKIAKRLLEIKQKYGPDSIGFIASCTGTNEEAYLLQKLARQVIGTNNVDNCARYCQAPATTGLIRTVGFGADSGSMEDIENAELVIIIGSNTAEAHPVLAGKIKRAKKLRGQKLIVIDVKRHEMAEWADIFLSPNPGTDLVLINGIAKYIIDMGWEDKEFILRRTEGFEEYKKSLEEYSLEYVEKVTGIKRDDIIRVAEMIHNSRSVVILWGMGITQHQDGSETSTAICNLLLLTGNFGRPNTGGYPLRGHANVQGVSDFGALPNFLPGYQDINDPEVRKKFEEAWQCSLPNNRGLTSTEMVDAALEGKLKALIIFGEDKVMADANQKKVREALSKLELLVVADMFMTETAKLAHFVLPSAASIEKEGTFVNTERRIQRLYKVMEPLGESRPDFEIIILLANALGAKWNYKSPAEVMEEIRKLVPIFAGVTYDRLEGFKSLQWPVKENGEDTRFLYSERFEKPNGKARFWPTKFIKPIETNEAFDVYLINGRVLEHFHWANMTGKSIGILHKLPEAFLEISEEIAKEKNLNDGDLVEIRSPNGEKIRLRVMVSTRLKGNRAFLALHSPPDQAVNKLTLDFKDPTSKTPAYKEVPICIEKIKGSTSRQKPLPKHNPRLHPRSPQIGVKVEEKWRREDYQKIID